MCVCVFDILIYIYIVLRKHHGSNLAVALIHTVSLVGYQVLASHIYLFLALKCVPPLDWNLQSKLQKLLRVEQFQMEMIKRYQYISLICPLYSTLGQSWGANVDMQGLIKVIVLIFLTFCRMLE